MKPALVLGARAHPHSLDSVAPSDSLTLTECWMLLHLLSVNKEHRHPQCSYSRTALRGSFSGVSGYVPANHRFTAVLLHCSWIDGDSSEFEKGLAKRGRRQPSLPFSKKKEKNAEN